MSLKPRCQVRRSILPDRRPSHQPDAMVDAYVDLVRDRSILEGIASCLTELFSPTIIAERVGGMLANYAFITAGTLDHFRPRPGSGTDGCRICPGLRQTARLHGGTAACGAGGTAHQVRYPLGNAGCAASGLC